MFSKIAGSLRRLGRPSNSSDHQRGNSRSRQAADDDLTASHRGANSNPERHAYTRPFFLALTAEDEMLSRDFQERPVLISNKPSLIPLGAGYAECINGGKSELNEDEAAVGSFHLPSHPNGLADAAGRVDMLDVQYFGIFDGHAGPGAALMAADQLVNHLQEKLVEIQDDLFLRLPRESTDQSSGDDEAKSVNITIDILITGALESAFCDFDEHIAREKNSFTISGGCAAVVVLVMLDRVYVAHAGDCRAVAYFGNETVLMAREFTPVSDSERIQMLANLKPELTQDVFSENYFIKPLTKRDIGQHVYGRLPHRKGWNYKEITEEDLAKPGLISGHGKFARLMGTIGVTRGFGDHSLTMPGTNIRVKPFLTPVPEVRVLNLTGRQLQESDALVVGSDGLWDLLTNEQAGACLKASWEATSKGKYSISERYTRAAEDLVFLARGENTGKGWKMHGGRDASFDDISCFVIPLFTCLSGNRKKVLGSKSSADGKVA